MSIDKKLHFIDLGLTHYQDVWEQQRSLQRKLIDNEGEQTILLCQHYPVITLGKGAKAENLLVSEELLKKQGVALFTIERGGDITFHGPGQLVVYPILNLNNYRRDVGWYMRTLEDIVLRTLSSFSIKAEKIEGKTGVWIKNRKIASIGVRLSRWCSMHGFSLNIGSDLSGYDFINPCGFTDIEMTSVTKENSALATSTIFDEVKKRVQQELTNCFGA